MVLIMAYGESLPVASYCLFTYFHTFDYATHFILFQDNTYIYIHGFIDSFILKLAIN